MSRLSHYPLSKNFAGVSNFETKGLNINGATYIDGIPGSFDLINAAARLTVRETDTPTYGERRTELVFKSNLDPTGERWYTWEFMIPSSWGSSNAGFAIMQIHESPGASVAVQFVLLLENNQLVARVPVDVTMPGTDSYRVGNHPFVFDRWYSMCLHANWQLNNTGFWEIYVDRVPMLKRFGFANAYNRELGGYLKLGIYNFSKASGWKEKIIYVRNVSIWSGNDGYQTVMGGVPLAPSRALIL